VYGSTKIPSNASYYTPKYCTGARLPHAWITAVDQHAIHHQPEVDVSYVSEFSASDIVQRRYSTLDLCAVDSFTFIIAKSNSTWRERIEQVESQLSACKFNTYELGSNFDVVPSPHGEKWVNDAALRSGGGLLVRPDQHILLPLKSDTSVEEIVGALRAHLGQ
jgi:hypothetical protein